MPWNTMQWARLALVVNAGAVCLGYGALAGLVALVYSAGPGETRVSAPVAFSVVFLVLLAIWAPLCVGAHRCLDSQGRRSTVAFWALVVCDAVLVVFPIGPAFSLWLVLLWRRARSMRP